ncbi:MAG: tetratricopeptide repeat protein [Sedimentisphaerales bacterium]|jgi:pentatricopeptide repeat protein
MSANQVLDNKKLGRVTVTLEHQQKHISILVYVGIAVATLVAYEPIRHNYFVSYDDDLYMKNPAVTGGITGDSINLAFTKFYAANWHPLTWLSHMLDYRLFGLNPTGHHLVSVAIHIVNALLLFWILTNITGTTWVSAFVAAAFALHPLQVESVAWIAERKTVLSGLFWLLTMASYIHYVRRPGFGRYLVVLLVFGLCIMTKPIVITLPLVLLLLDYWPLDRIRWGHQRNNKARNRPDQKTIGWLIAEKMPLLAMSAILGVLTVIAQQSGGAISTLDKVPLDDRIANALVSYVKYIGKLVWPSDLAVFYPPSHSNLSNAATAICAFIFIVISAISIYIGRRKKYIAVGWLWFAGTLVPMIGLIQVGDQAMANRYMYLPMLGLLIIIAMAGKELIGKLPQLKTIAAITGVTAILSLLILTQMQVRHWRNSITLFEYALSVTEDNAITENSYACALFNEDRLDEAEQHFGNALRINPEFDTALIHLARIYLKEGRYDEAVSIYEELIKRNHKTPELYYNLAMALRMQEKYDESIKYFNKSLELNPNDAECLDALASSFAAAGRFAEAKATAEKALKLARETGLNDLAVAIENRIKLYEAGQSHREK